MTPAQQTFMETSLALLQLQTGIDTAIIQTMFIVIADGLAAADNAQSQAIIDAERERRAKPPSWWPWWKQF